MKLLIILTFLLSTSCMTKTSAKKKTNDDSVVSMPSSSEVNELEKNLEVIFDRDSDGVDNSEDNCEYTYNPNQVDLDGDGDGDGVGDVCDPNPTGEVETPTSTPTPQVTPTPNPPVEGPQGVINIVPELRFNPKFNIQKGIDQSEEEYEWPNPGIIPGPTNGWKIAQWNKSEKMKPNYIYRYAPSTYDQYLGRRADYAIPSVDSEVRSTNISHVWAYRKPSGVHVYELHSKNGTYWSAGGSNVFLTTEPLIGVNTTMNRAMKIDLRSRIKAHFHEYFNIPDIMKSAVLWQYFIGMTFHLDTGRSGELRFVNLFLQIPLSDSRAVEGYSGPPNYIASTGHDGAIFSRTLEEDKFFTNFSKFKMYPLSFDLNMYLCEAVNASYPIQGTSSHFRYDQIQGLKTDPFDLNNWKFNSLYIGLETQAMSDDTITQNFASGASSETERQQVLSLANKPLGNAIITVQLKDIFVRKDFDMPRNCSDY